MSLVITWLKPLRIWIQPARIEGKARAVYMFLQSITIIPSKLLLNGKNLENTLQKHDEKLLELGVQPPR